MLSRRDFMQSTAAYGALAATGLLNARPAGAAATWVAPASIPNDRSANASAALTDWLATTGQPGDTFQLRRGPGFAPGDYWVPQGVKIGKPMTLDLNGCWLRTGTTLGFDDPNLAASKAAFPPLWNDWGEQTDAGVWPGRRCVLVIAASNVTVMSSLVHGRIQGAARTVHYRGSPTGPVGRTHPAGCAFHDANFGERHFGDGQHGIRIGGRPGTYSNTTFYQDITIDLTNISVEFVHGDGIDFNDNHRRVTVKGRQVGEATIGGVPGPFDDQHLLGHSLAGGTIQQNGGPQWDPADPRTSDRWVPDTLTIPGVHHTGRHGLATGFRTYQPLLDGFSVWHTRTFVDWEPEASFSEVIDPTMRNMEVGIHRLKFMPAAGANGPVNNLLMENIISYEVPSIDTHQQAAATDARYSNWVIRNVRCPSGVKARVGAIFQLPRIDGLQVRDCHVPLRGTAVGVLTDTGGTGVNGPSTGVVIKPAMDVQFPRSS